MALLGAGGTIVMVTGASQVDGLDAVRHGYAQAGAVGGGILVVAAIVVFALTWRRRSLPAEVGAAHDETSRRNLTRFVSRKTLTGQNWPGVIQAWPCQGRGVPGACLWQG
jgi:hypothetical protein